MYKSLYPIYKKWRHTLDVSTIQMHEAPAVVSDYKINLKSPQTFANTIEDIEALSEEMLSDYQKTLERASLYNILISSRQLEQQETPIQLVNLLLASVYSISLMMVSTIMM